VSFSFNLSYPPEQKYQSESLLKEEETAFSSKKRTRSQAKIEEVEVLLKKKEGGLVKNEKFLEGINPIWLKYSILGVFLEVSELDLSKNESGEIHAFKDMRRNIDSILEKFFGHNTTDQVREGIYKIAYQQLVDFVELGGDLNFDFQGELGFLVGSILGVTIGDVLRLEKELEEALNGGVSFEFLCEKVNTVACRQLFFSQKKVIEKKHKDDFKKKLDSIVERPVKLSLEETTAFTLKSLSEIETLNKLDLEGLFSFISLNSTKQMRAVEEVLSRLIEALKDESKVSQLIAFCLNEYEILFSRYPSEPSTSGVYFRFQLLFVMFDYLGLDEFQKKYFEPFNRVFPMIPLNQAPETIQSLVLKESDLGSMGLSAFRYLRELISVNSIKESDCLLKSVQNKLSLNVLRIKEERFFNIDFTGFTNIQDLCLADSSTSFHYKIWESVKTIPEKSKVKELSLNSFNMAGFNFFDFPGLEVLKLSNLSHLSAELFNNIPLRKEVFISLNGRTIASGDTEIIIPPVICNRRNIERLVLTTIYITGFSFSNFVGLKNLTLNAIRGIKGSHLNSIPEKEKLEHFRLSSCSFQGENDFSDEELVADHLCKLSAFSGFKGLRELELLDKGGFSCFKIEAVYFNAIPNKEFIEKLILERISVEYFNFSEFKGLRHLSLSNSKYLTSEQFNTIPNKGSIEFLDLTGVDVTGFDFSKLTGLKKVELRDVRGLTRDQFDSIPNK
jgi:hypothetical protein